MQLSDGTQINEGDKVTLDPEQVGSTGSKDAHAANGITGIVSGIDEEDRLITVNLDGMDMTVEPSAILDVSPLGRER